MTYYNFMFGGIFRFLPKRFLWHHDGIVIHNGVPKSPIAFDLLFTLFGVGICIYLKQRNGLMLSRRYKPVHGILLGRLSISNHSSGPGAYFS